MRNLLQHTQTHAGIDSHTHTRVHFTIFRRWWTEEEEEAAGAVEEVEEEEEEGTNIFRGIN